MAEGCECNPPKSLLLFLQSAPAEVVFGAFEADCAARGLLWCSRAGQELAVTLFVRHPISIFFPPRASARRAFLKYFLSRIDQPELLAKGAIAPGGEADDVHDDLMEAYITASTGEYGDDAMCFKSYFNSFIELASAPPPSSAAVVAPSAEVAQQQAAIAASHFCPVRLASGQLSNVGLAMWPAGLLLVQLLARELEGESHLLSRFIFPERSWDGRGFCKATAAQQQRPEHARLRLLELGAGVGLTPVFLHRTRAYRECVSDFIITDYLPEVVDNAAHNLRLNGATVVTDLRAAAMGLEGACEPPYHLVASMDWTQRVINESLLLDWGYPDVVLAADCIYDAQELPGLVSLLELLLRGPPGGGLRAHHKHNVSGARGTTCVIAQTHRQDYTMKIFFDAVRVFADVQSYSLVRYPAEEVRQAASARLDGADGGCVALEPYPPALVAEDGAPVLMAALRPDKVLANGSLESMQAPQNAMANLSDALIGNFYTTMTGLLAVHVLRLRADV